MRYNIIVNYAWGYVDTVFVKDAAKLWNISERRVSALCKKGQIKGAVKQGKSWLIPTDAEKPVDGRYDIQLKPMQKNLPGILIEIKAEKNCTKEQLKKLSETALKQINDKKYDTLLIATGVKTVYKYGVAFSGKNVEVSVG